MYINSGYHNHSLIDFKDKSRPLIVGSCGTYRLSSHPKLPTYRPKGRLDFQIIYIAAGRAHFHFDNTDDDTVVTAGNIHLYWYPTLWQNLSHLSNHIQYDHRDASLPSLHSRQVVP